MKMLKIDKRVELVEIAEHGGEPSVDVLRAEVRGEVSYIDIGDDAVVLVNASAEASGMQQNPIASLIARRQLYGPALIAGADGTNRTLADTPEDFVVLLGLES